MTSCIYYDLPEVTAADVARARQFAGTAAVHVHPADISWPDDCPVAAHTIAGARDAVVRAALSAWLDSVQAGVGRCEFRSVDLVEIVRMQWLGGLLDDFHRAWAASEMTLRWQPTTIHWLARSPRPFAALASYCARQRVRLVSHAAPLVLARSRCSQAVGAALRWLWEVREWRRTAALARRRWAQASPASSSSGPIVFAEYYPNSAKIALQIAAEVDRHRQSASLLVAGRPSVARAFEARGMPCRLLDEFRLAPGGAGRLDRRNLAEATRTFMAAVARLTDDAFAVRAGGSPAAELLRPAMVREARRDLPAAAHWVQAVWGLVQSLHPAAVVSTTYSSDFGRALAAVCRAADVPSVYVQHGLFPDDAFWVRFLNHRILVWGESNRRAFVAAGVDAERIRVIGVPGHDGLTGHAATPSEPNGRPTRFLYLASRTGGTVVSRPVARRTALAIADAVLAADDRELVVKLHPGDHTGLIPELLANRPRVRIEQQASSFDVIRAADVVIVNSSTTGLESCALDKPMIVFNLTGAPQDVDYRSYGAALCVQREEELAVAADRVQHDPATRAALSAGRRRLVDDMLAGASGGATAAAAEAILEVARQD